MTSPPLAVVLNRRAGVGRAGHEWPRLRGELEALGVEYCLIDCDTPAEALTQARALPASWALATVGGDGTAASVLPEAIEGGRPLLVLPYGTGNDFAGTLGLRPGDFRSALRCLSRPPQRVDALRVTYELDGTEQSAYVLNGLGMGFDAQLTAMLPVAPAWTRGAVRYVWAALGSLRAMQTNHCAVTLDGEPWASGPTMLCSVMNARTLGGGFQFNPDADLSDGQLNVVLAAAVHRREVPGLIARVRGGHHLTHPAVKYHPAQVAELRWDQPTYLHIDGEVRGQSRWLRAEVLSGAVTLLNQVG